MPRENDLLTLSATLPVAPGTSPFHARGFVYRRLMEHVDESGHREALLSALAPDVRDFINQKFNLSGWYDVFPTIPVSMALAQIEGRPYEARLFERGRDAALTAIPKLFRALMSMTTPQAVAQRLGAFSSQQYDFLTLSNIKTGTTGGRATIVGVPQYVAPYVLNVNAGFIAGAIELARIKAVDVRVVKHRRSDDVRGFPAISADVLIAWS